MDILKLILGPLITFTVGGFAIGLYAFQNKDNRRKAAQLILQEIRYAEQHIRNFRDSSNYVFSDKLLPTNNWNKNIHLFVKSLSETQLDLISRFYANAAYIDQVVGKISDEANSIKVFKQLTPSFPQVVVGPRPSTNQSSPQPQTPIPPIINIQQVESNSQKILKEVSNAIELIYNTPSVEKLREIARGKIFLVF